MKQKGLWLELGPLLILAGAAALLLWRAIFPPFPGYILSRESGDVASLYYYWRAFGFESLRAGIIPLWNPFVFCGTPFAAYPEAALFYPLNLVFLLLPLATALNWSFAGHLLLLAATMFAWLRFTGSGRIPALLGGVTLLGSGPVILHLTAGHLSNICTFAWVPLLFLLAEGWRRYDRWKWAAGAGVILALQLLAGHWQYVYYTVLFLAAYLLGRTALEGKTGWKNLHRLPAAAGLAGVIALGLAAIQILPALDLARDSFRRGLDLEWAGAFALPPANLATLILPGWLGDTIGSLYRGENYYWEMCAYLGVIPLTLAAGAAGLRKDRLTLLCALLTALAVVVSLGDSTPLFRALYRALPGFRYFRGHAKLLFFAVFFLATLAARGADNLFGRGTAAALRGSRRFRRRLVLSGTAALGFAGGAALLFAASAGETPPGWWRARIADDLFAGRHYDIAPPGQPQWWQELLRQTPPELDYPAYVRRLVGETPVPRDSWRTLRRGAGRLGLAVGALGLLAGAIIIRPRRRNWWAGAVALLAALEVLTWAAPYVTGFDRRICLWDREIAGFFDRQDQPFRYLAFDPADFNRGMTPGFPSVLGYQADVPRRYLEYLNFSQGLSPDNLELVPLITEYSPLLDLLNPRFLLFPPGTAPELPWLRAASGGDGGEIRENLRAQPRVLISDRAREFLFPEDILPALDRPGYRPVQEIYLEETPPPGFRDGGRGGPGAARVLSQGSNEVLLEAILSRPGFLLLNDSFAPGWKASVNGEETRIYRANYLMRAVALEAGEHTVRFFYRPAAFVAGAAISSAGGVILLLSSVWSLVRRRKKSPLSLQERDLS